MKFFLIIALISIFSTNSYSNWKRYPFNPNGSKISFPKDEGRHSTIPNLEWWYTVIHAKGEITGDRYSILVSHFNNNFRFFTVTNIDKELHRSGTVLGILNSKKGYLDLKHKTKYGTDIYKSKRDSSNKLIPFSYEIKTHHEQMQLEVSLDAIKKPLMVGGDGYLPVGKSGNTWYYSLTRLSSIGKITIDGFTEKIVGQAWMDHQWGPFLVSPVPVGKLFESYEWFCLQLNDGTDIMISNIYNRKRQLPIKEGYGGIEYIDINGVSKRTLKRKFTRTNYWQDPVTGHYMSMGWRLEVPEWNLDLKMTPDFVEQMVRFPLNGDFWEGSIHVNGTINGKRVSGKSFGELMHRFETPEIKFEKVSINKKDKVVKVKWNIKNSDAGNPLSYDIDILENDNLTTLIKNTRNNYLSIPFSKFNNKNGKVQVRAHSIDNTISNTSTTKQIKL